MSIFLCAAADVVAAAAVVVAAAAAADDAVGARCLPLNTFECSSFCVPAAAVFVVVHVSVEIVAVAPVVAAAATVALAILAVVAVAAIECVLAFLGPAVVGLTLDAFVLGLFVRGRVNGLLLISGVCS